MDTTGYVWSFKRGRTLNLSVECQLEVFDKMIKPILLYGSDIWGFSKNIDSLQARSSLYANTQLRAHRHAEKKKKKKKKK
jgi:hypothetical protein